MIENINNFATLNPWTMLVTLLSLFLLIIMIFLFYEKKKIANEAKINSKMLTVFMIFIICIFVACLVMIAVSPDFATLIDKENGALVYWVIMGVILDSFRHFTGVDPLELLYDMCD